MVRLELGIVLLSGGGAYIASILLQSPALIRSSAALSDYQLLPQWQVYLSSGMRSRSDSDVVLALLLALINHTVCDKYSTQVQLTTPTSQSATNGSALSSCDDL